MGPSCTRAPTAGPARIGPFRRGRCAVGALLQAQRRRWLTGIATGKRWRHGQNAQKSGPGPDGGGLSPLSYGGDAGQTSGYAGHSTRTSSAHPGHWWPCWRQRVRCWPDAPRGREAQQTGPSADSGVQLDQDGFAVHTGEAKRGGTIRVLGQPEFSHLDPAMGNDGGVNNFYRLIYRTLVTPANETGPGGTKI